MKTWADVRDGWPAERLRLYGPGTDSGTFDYFTKAINGQEQALDRISRLARMTMFSFKALLVTCTHLATLVMPTTLKTRIR